MLTLQKTFKYDGVIKEAIFSILKLKFNYPVFKYSVSELAGSVILREVLSYQTLIASHELDSAAYKVELPFNDIVGSDTTSINNFKKYMQQAFLQKDFNIENISFNVDVVFSDAESNTPIGAQTFQAFCLLKNTQTALINRSTTANSDSQQASLAASQVELINRAGYDKIFAGFTSVTKSHDESFLINLLQFLLSVCEEGSHSLSHLSVAISERLLKELTVIDLNEPKKALEMICSEFPQLFEFSLHVKEIKPLEVGGVFVLKATDGVKISQNDVNLYDISAEYAMLSDNQEVGFANDHVDWTTNKGVLKENAIEFSFSAGQPIIASAVHGSIAIMVKSFDGAVVWSKSYKPKDPSLQKLRIEIPLQRPSILSDADKKGISNKKLRGKLVAINSTVSLKDVTVLIQAKHLDSSTWKIVAATTTDGFGNFSMAYPFGQYMAAQAVVSLTANSPVDIPVDVNQLNGETISDEFLYLLIQGVNPAVEPPKEDCECTATKNVPRLPDQSDLINSNDYTQDMGGSCVNLSTPNRTLREFNYQAIVRTSDPDVSNYTLTKKNDGSFDLTGGFSKIKRADVDLNNPIKWQDAPDYHSNLTVYQAVTVATGHILHYKSEFKADGYSLGDLLYSLPLAPGQKKQIVVFDSSHNLRAAEAQSLSQTERLAANITDERDIVDQLGGGINEATRGSSDATTSGVSAGVGASGSAGFFGASLGVAGGYANANSSASQNSSRNVSQFFGEKLRQSIMQNSNSYRQQNASVVTTVQEGQHYSAETEVVANHNHCHPLTMMYFEVLRHYAVFQELASVEECVFVPLLMTHFTADNICKWRDVLARHLLSMPSNTYLAAFRNGIRGGAHPLLKAFDANDRIRTNYVNVDFPKTTYDDEVISYISGDMTIRVNLPRPKTQYDRIKSLPIILKAKDVDHSAAVKSAALAVCTGGLSLLFGDSAPPPVLVQSKAQLFDSFMQMDANYETVAPAQCMRVVNFRGISITIGGITFNFAGGDFFQNSILDKTAWEAYAFFIGYNDPLDMLDYYFRGRLIAEWDSIFYNDIIPVVFNRIIENIQIAGIACDWSSNARYKGGERIMRISMQGKTSKKRNEFLPEIVMTASNFVTNTIHDQVTFVVQNVNLHYSTPHYNGSLFHGNVNNDLLDKQGVTLYAPENSDEKRNPRKEDIFIVQKLIEHLNSNLEHYNKALWFNLDSDRRFMLLDGFNIQIYNDFGQPAGYRSLASIVKNTVISIVGNSLVLPVAAGYKISKSYIIEQTADGSPEDVSLLDHYKPITPSQPYRISVPSRGVFLEAVKGNCDACEAVEDNTSQDWTKFTTDEPTQIMPVAPPTPTITDWQAVFKDFATPIVNIQNAPTLPSAGAGLAGLSDLLGKSDTFNDITGLAGNQANAIKTLQSNNENVRALAEASKGLAMQQHNTSNSGDIMGSLKKAKDTGGITQQEYSDLLKNHLQQVIDGGDSKKAEIAASKPSLTEAAVKAAGEGKSVKAISTGAEGGSETIAIEGAATENVLAEVKGNLPLLKQTNAMACWATVATMMVNWKKQQNWSVLDVVTSAGATYMWMFKNEEGLSSSEKPAFLTALGMVGETPNRSYQLSEFIDLIKTYGPLWLTCDSNLATGKFAPHARILVKITGTGTPDGNGTFFTFINPSTGAMETESFAKFLAGFEQMVTDSPSQNLFTQIVHFSSKVSGDNSSNSNIKEGADASDKDPLRLQAEVAAQLLKYSGYGAGTSCRIVADYVIAKMEQIWQGQGGIVGMVDHHHHDDLVNYLASSKVPATYVDVATEATSWASEAFPQWDPPLLPAGKDPATWAYTRPFLTDSLPYCVIRFFKLESEAYKKDYMPILAHEVCHFILYKDGLAFEKDYRDFLYADTTMSTENRKKGALARNRCLQEIVGRRMNFLVHKEIDVPVVSGVATPATLGKSIYADFAGQNLTDPYYSPITEFLNLLPTVQKRHEQVGIWLQTFVTTAHLFNNATFSNQLKDDFNYAGHFLKTATDAEYDAEISLGIH
ncbi:MAG: hypothetical protein NTW85_11270 [Methylococcales bacterium]|nr:hypothetical protein [Methylococcales bacterium]